ncbi:hypothetical protein HRbin05_00316 [archaeon HR05]|nr:hypothetical protein HRbin05_00316 [archaeon HR05]
MNRTQTRRVGSHGSSNSGSSKSSSSTKDMIAM